MSPLEQVLLSMQAPHINRQRVLVAEDDKLVGHVYYNVLTRAGFEVEWVMDGLALLKRFEQYPPDAILVDIMMPGMNGVEAIKAIRAQPKGAVPIVAVTNAFVDSLVVTAQLAGANTVLSKATLDPLLLVHTIKMLLLPDGVAWAAQQAKAL